MYSVLSWLYRSRFCRELFILQHFRDLQELRNIDRALIVYNTIARFLVVANAAQSVGVAVFDVSQRFCGTASSCGSLAALLPQRLCSQACCFNEVGVLVVSLRSQCFPSLHIRGHCFKKHRNNSGRVSLSVCREKSHPTTSIKQDSEGCVFRNLH